MHLIHQPVLDIAAPQIRPLQIADQFLNRWRILERVLWEDVQQPLRLLCGDDGLAHKPDFAEVFPNGTASPLRMDSRILGIETR